MVNAGKMNAREAAAVQARAQMTELQYDVRHLSLEDAIEIYKEANTQERAELLPVMEAKREGLGEMSETRAALLDTKLKELGIE